MTDIADIVIAHTPTHTDKNTTEESKYLWGNCSRTLQLCHLAAPNHCPLKLAMEAGSSCLSAVPSFSPRLSISFSCFSNVDGKLSRNAKTERLCICECMFVYVSLNIMAVPPVWHTSDDKMWKPTHILSQNSPAYTNIHESTHAYTFTLKLHSFKHMHTHTHTNL